MGPPSSRAAHTGLRREGPRLQARRCRRHPLIALLRWVKLPATVASGDSRSCASATLARHGLMQLRHAHDRARNVGVQRRPRCGDPLPDQRTCVQRRPPDSVRDTSLAQFSDDHRARNWRRPPSLQDTALDQIWALRSDFSYVLHNWPVARRHCARTRASLHGAQPSRQCGGGGLSIWRG